MPRAVQQIRKPIGWDGKTLKEMLNESRRQFEEIGSYCGVTNLTLKAADPLKYERLYSRLRGMMVASREAALRVSASPIVKELGELCFALYTPEGDSVVLSTGIIVHVHTMSMAIKWMIDNDYEGDPCIDPGDVFGNNDPLIGDAHTADVQSLTAIFYGDEVIGWVGAVTHVMDCGGVDAHRERAAVLSNRQIFACTRPPGGKKIPEVLRGARPVLEAYDIGYRKPASKIFMNVPKVLERLSVREHDASGEVSLEDRRRSQLRDFPEHLFAFPKLQFRAATILGCKHERDLIGDRTRERDFVGLP